MAKAVGGRQVVPTLRAQPKTALRSGLDHLLPTVNSADLKESKASDAAVSVRDGQVRVCSLKGISNTMNTKSGRNGAPKRPSS